MTRKTLKHLLLHKQSDEIGLVKYIKKVSIYILF